MSYERGKLYRVVESKCEGMKDEKLIFKVVPEDLPLSEPGVVKGIEIDTKQGHELEPGDIFMFLQYELGYSGDRLDAPKYLVLLFDQAVWTSNSPWYEMEKVLKIERVA